MATLTKKSRDEIDKTSRSGIDLILIDDVGSINTGAYMLAHFAGITSREKRCQMYKDMLEHGIQHHNDGLAFNGLKGGLLHIFKQRETSREAPALLLESLCNEQKEDEWFKQAELAIDLLEQIVTTFSFYSRKPGTSDGWSSSQFNLARLPMTWKLVINEVSKLCWVKREFGDGAGSISSTNIKAFLLYLRLGTTEIFRTAAKKVANEASYGYESWHLVDVREDVIANLKDNLSKMPLERVIFWLKNYGEAIPFDFKKVFRIEFVRKGGKINLDE